MHRLRTSRSLFRYLSSRRLSLNINSRSSVGNENVDVVIVGGGASGVFCAACILEKRPLANVVVLEATRSLLKKVRISGGGRCNVTHAVSAAYTDGSKPYKLNFEDWYPRGGKSLLGRFSAFGFAESRGWFESKGVLLKEEEDGRVFPVSDDSQTIVDTLLYATRGAQFEQSALVTGVKLNPGSGSKFQIEYTCKNRFKSNENENKSHDPPPNHRNMRAKCVVLAPGASIPLWKAVKEEFDLQIVPPVPSLFTFKMKDHRLEGLAGISLQNVDICFADFHILTQRRKKKTKANVEKGPIIITHSGLSGPAILKMSSRFAVEFHELKYKVRLEIDWTGGLYHEHDIVNILREQKKLHPNRRVTKFCPIVEVDLQDSPLDSEIKRTSLLPRRLWARLVMDALNLNDEDSVLWSELTNADMRDIASNMISFQIDTCGKSTHKEEFVTAGGVDLKQFTKHFEAKTVPNLFCIGEYTNVDGITGGFNFTACWSSGWHAANRIVELLTANSQ